MFLGNFAWDEPIVLRVLSVTREPRTQTNASMHGPQYVVRVVFGDANLRAFKTQLTVELCERYGAITKGSVIEVTGCVPMFFHVASMANDSSDAAPVVTAPVEAPTLSTSDTNGDAAAVTGPSILPTLDVSVSGEDADGDTGAPAGPGIDATPGIAADVDGTVGFIQLWLSISEFNVLYDPGTADDQLGVHTFAFVSAESFMKKRKEKAERIAAGEEPAHVHVVMDETLSDNCEPFWENELTVTSDGKKVLSVTCDGSCCGDVDSKTYFPKCLMEMRPVESVDLEMVRFSTFFAQQHLDKDLSNALTRNLLY